MENFDVVIIGAGTAGLMLARELGNQNRKILVVDRRTDLLNFSFNTLGSFINLDDFGLTENVVSQKLNNIVISSKYFNHNLSASAYILDKTKVHEELINSINSKYVTIQKGININGISKNENGEFSSIVDTKGNHYSGRIFVDASGTNGVISKTVGLREKTVQLATGVEYNVKYLGNSNEGHLLIGKQYQGGYGWIFPLKDNRAIIGFGTFDNSIIKNLKPRLNKILEIPSIKKLVLKDNDKVEGGSIPITPVLDQFVLNNLVCVGDSVSQVNPIVGEGYKFIFESAIMASKSINASIENEDLKLLSQYETDWKNRFLSNYKRSKAAQEKIFKYSKNESLISIAMILAKLRSNKKNLQSLSGEY